MKSTKLNKVSGIIAWKILMLLDLYLIIEGSNNVYTHVMNLWKIVTNRCRGLIIALDWNNSL